MPVPLNPTSAPWLHDAFLISNLHCPSCVAQITAILSELAPAPTIQTISMVDHVVTIAHDRSITAAAISELLGRAAYEVFDVVLDPDSREEASPFGHGDPRLDAAVRKWDPRNKQLSASVRETHESYCQMCAEYHSITDSMDFEGVTIAHSKDTDPTFLAVLSLEGMTCSSCVGNVTNALNQIAFVQSAEVALVNHSANIKFAANDSDTAVKQLIEAVEDVGYGAELVELKPESTSAKLERIRTTDAWQASYSIDGMSCSSCVGKITSAVEGLPFVEKVDINLVAHSGTVVFIEKDRESQIAAAINDTGYKATLDETRDLGERESKPSRAVSLVLAGIYCPKCPQRLVAALAELSVRVEKPPSMADPILKISYVPDAPTLTLRSIIAAINKVDQSFSVSIHKPPSIEERSRKMLARERRAIFLRALLAITTAIPTLVIGIAYMNLVSHHDPGYMYIMQPIYGVSRAEWATFAMANPVYFFAADHFHKRTIKGVYALWRPRSPVPISQRFYRFGSMNMLISLGTTIAYFSSLAMLIVSASHPSKDAMEVSKQSYFDSVVFLTMFLLLGRLAEAHMKAKSGDAVAALGKLRPTEASLVIGSGESEASTIERIGMDLIDTGDVVKVSLGSTPPCDGILLNDDAKFDESSLTGESRLILKSKGDTIFSGTVNKGSAISVRVTGPTGASLLDSIIKVVREGQAKRAPMERVADLLTAYFVPVIVAIAILTWIVWLALGLSGKLPSSYMDNSIGGWEFWSLQFAIAVFVIACPCGLGLAAPTALFVGGGLAAKRGILVKGGGEAFQEASNLDAVVFDKTGTLTQGAEPKIVQDRTFTSLPGIDEATTMAILKGIEENSSHPLARAAVDFASSRSATVVQIPLADEIPGKGLKASFQLPNGESRQEGEALVGNESLMDDYSVVIDQDATKLLSTWKGSGYSVILMAGRTSEKWQLLAIFAAADPLRPEAADVVRALRAQNVEVWMLSGDDPSTARAVGSLVGIPPENIIAGVLPAQKADKVKHLQQTAKQRRGRNLLSSLTNQRSRASRATIAMVGDGINDAPALAAADVGIAVASGSDVAVQSAAFVLVQPDLRAVLTLVTLSRAVFRRVIVNFFWAAIYNMIALPIAAGVLYPVRTSGGGHVRLDPAWAALAMALSSFTVVGSSLLLRTKTPWVGFRE